MKIQTAYYAILPYFSEIWSRAEKSNDAKAQFELAKLYSVSKNKSLASRAFLLYKNAADQRYTKITTDAMFELGKCYETGCGIKRSYVQAVKWYERAEHYVINDLKNNPDPVGKSATELIRNRSESGQLDELLRFDDEFIDSKKEAAERGDTEAQSFLTELYYFGGEVEQSYEKSAYWAAKTAEAGDAKAQNHLGHIYYYGQGVEKNYELSFYWSLKAAGQGSEAAMRRLGEYYRSLRHYREAAKWYRKYAEQRIRRRNDQLGW